MDYSKSFEPILPHMLKRLIFNKSAQALEVGAFLISDLMARMTTQKQEVARHNNNNYQFRYESEKDNYVDYDNTNLSFYEQEKDRVNNTNSKFELPKNNSNSYIKDDPNFFGIPILEFLPTNYYDFKNTTQVFQTPHLTLYIADIRVSKQNDIIRTRLMNEIGTIKEVWGQDDYSVDISGVLIGNHGVVISSDYMNLLPKTEIDNLIKIANSNIGVKITSKYLERFGITNLQIANFDLPYESKLKNIQTFSLKCYSDDPNLKIGK